MGKRRRACIVPRRGFGRAARTNLSHFTTQQQEGGNLLRFLIASDFFFRLPRRLQLVHVSLQDSHSDRLEG